MSYRTPGRLYLKVPYAEKEQAKTVGARWDPEAKSWYVPGASHLDVDSPLYARWSPEVEPAPLPQVSGNVYERRREESVSRERRHWKREGGA